MTNRKDSLLSAIDLKNGKGLELGPLCWPLVLKNEANIKYVDHVSTSELKKIYSNDAGVNLNQIVEVDFPLNGRTLHQTVGDAIPYDYIIASHVIEHVPDIVGWLQDISSVLKVNGIVSLAIPDKRYTFDIDREDSTPGDVVGAYFDEYKRPSSSTLFDYASKFRLNIDSEKVWSGELYLESTAPPRYSLKQASELCLENKKHYVDAHCFVFTPYSFFEILRVLIELELTDFKVHSFNATEVGAYEFIVSLQKVRKNIGKKSQLHSLPKLSRPLLSRESEAKIQRLELSEQSLGNDLRQTRKELNRILKSKSWRYTRPMRFILQLVSKH